MSIIVASPGTPLVCFKCHDTEARAYRMRRLAGKYILLCFKEGVGCWERTPHMPCEFKDSEGIQCTLLAEWKVCFGADMLVRTDVCCIHVGAVLSDVSEHRVFPIDE
jgi:hypothetical protein